jgi:hypothetical protein
MMKTTWLAINLGLAAWLLSGCGPAQPETTDRQTKAQKLQYLNLEDPRLIHHAVKQVTDLIVYDVFSPPVASRIYAYTSLAAYEALRHQDGSPSLVAKFNGFGSMPQPEAGKTYVFPAAALKAVVTVADKVTFTKDSLFAFEQAALAELRRLAPDTAALNRSLAFGEQVGKAVLARAAQDNYKETRGMPRYTVRQQPGLWQPTAPDYNDAAEPHWGKMLPLALDSAGQCAPPPPPPFDLKPGSAFAQALAEVKNLRPALTEEQQEIAYFWDDNPFVTHHTGHATFASKKMTPGGHWMAIAGLNAQQAQAGIVKTAQCYALCAVALYDAFIACWHEKYRSQYVRPITVINQTDPQWEPFLQTPAFPEYTSGHGVISAAAATVLTATLGDNQAFTDTTEVEYGRPVRKFTSFRQAAAEASLSRVYGGIHYRFTAEVSGQQGQKIGQAVWVRTGLGPAN